MATKTENEKQVIGKAALVDKVAEASEGISKKDIAEVLTKFMEIVVESVRAGDEIRLIGFGTFKKAHRAERTGRNPQTGETIKIKASDSLSFHSNVKF